MTQTVTAVYENGVLRPTTPLPVPEGTSLRLRVTTEEDSLMVEGPTDFAAVREIMARIAQATVETGPIEHVSANVDRYLYVETFGGRRRDAGSEPRSGGSS